MTLSDRHAHASRPTPLPLGGRVSYAPKSDVTESRPRSCHARGAVHRGRVLDRRPLPLVGRVHHTPRSHLTQSRPQIFEGAELPVVGVPRLAGPAQYFSWVRPPPGSPLLRWQPSGTSRCSAKIGKARSAANFEPPYLPLGGLKTNSKCRNLQHNPALSFHRRSRRVRSARAAKDTGFWQNCGAHAFLGVVIVGVVERANFLLFFGA